MKMKIVPTGQLDWPPPYKAATEQYSPQVSLSPSGELQNYVAGLPFPTLEADDPQVATKIMWNLAFRPQYTDDIGARNVEIVSHRPGLTDPIEEFSIGHMGFYKYVGRTEVNPVPIHRSVFDTGISYRAGAFPFLEPAEFRGAGIIMEGSVRPGIEDIAWEYSPATRRLRRLLATEMSDAFGVSRAGDGVAKTEVVMGCYLCFDFGSGLLFWFRWQNPRFQLQVPWRASHACVGRGCQFSGAAVHRRRRSHGLPRSLGAPTRLRG